MSETLTLMTPGPASTLDTRNTKYQTIKGKVHHDLLNRLRQAPIGRGRSL